MDDDRTYRGAILGFSHREDCLALNRIGVKLRHERQWSLLTLYHVLAILSVRYQLTLLYAPYHLIWCCDIYRLLRGAIYWCFARGRPLQDDNEDNDELCSTWETNFNIYWEQLLRWTFFTLLDDDEEEEEEEGDADDEQEEEDRPLVEQLLQIQLERTRRRIARLESRAKRRERRRHLRCRVQQGPPARGAERFLRERHGRMLMLFLLLFVLILHPLYFGFIFAFYLRRISRFVTLVWSYI
ncbi:hypothetical protein B0T20DRAFT_100650 [Sordaria brevicollis]|uniref:Uncharacterized protein n=1 Tax=Sordaria brevicollis TaxID=83679 RepID=A0AAE0NVR8_SORBR|nr:hypothetical protein B0T20DRAFT_100650 [Sordaria brevicollis]